MSQPAPAAAPATDTDAVARAAAVVDLGLAACDAYHREDLAARLQAARRTLTDPGIHVVVAGEFKKGKSSLVNALLGAAVCPVDDDAATALPTYVRYGEQVEAALLHPGDPPRQEPVPIDRIREHVVAEGEFDPAPELAGVVVRLPRTMLAGGLVVVDTPGVGGIASAHARASLAAISMADAVVFVTDASQELTGAELDFLTQARKLCADVVCVVTKTDFYPAWRTVRDLDQRHLAALGDVPLLTVSSALRQRAVRGNDAQLNTESGFPALVDYVTKRVSDGGLAKVASAAAAEVVAVCRQIEASFEAEQATLSDPQATALVVQRLQSAKQRAESLRSAAARWQQTLGDGVGDLTSDIDHDLRRRIREVIVESDEAIELADPADAWAEVSDWLQTRVSEDVLANYVLLRDRAARLSAQVAEHFQDASGEVLDRLEVFNPNAVLSGSRLEAKVDLERLGVGKQAMTMLRSSYGGMIMFTMLGSLAGLTLGPISLGIGLVMGRQGLREERRRHLQQRRSQARNAVRKYCDDVSFAIGKDSRDTLRRIQRQLRDHYTARAEELNRSNAQALQQANETAQRGEADRAARLKDVGAELDRLRALRSRAATVRG
jgi:hypothetical protein